MKYLILITIVLFTFSCEKETCSDDILNQDEVQVDCGGSCFRCPVQYPETGAFGTNILYGYDTVFLTNQNSSMRAFVPEGSSLKVELYLISGEGWFYTSEQNWTISTFANNNQSFTVLNPGFSDLNLFNMDTTNVDTVLIKYFENGSQLTRQKVLVRE